MKWRVSLKGGSLMYALGVSMMVGAVLGGFVLLGNFQSRRVRKALMPRYAAQNMRSGLTAYLARKDTGRWAYPLFGTPRDSTEGWDEQWGWFRLAHIVGIHIGYRDTGTFLVGQPLVDEWRFSLHIADRGVPISLIGRTSWSGRIYLPEAGVREEFVHGRIYPDSQQKDERDLRSRDHIVQFGLPSGYKGRSWLLGLPRSNGKDYEWRKERVDHGWRNPARSWGCPGNLILKEDSLSGKQLIWCADTLEIYGDCRLDQVILLARHLRIHSGFRGQIQAIVSGSVLLESGVQLQYPSILAVHASGEAPVSVTLEVGSRLEGALLVDYGLLNARVLQRDQVRVAEGAEIWGLISVPEGLDMRGKAYGPVVMGTPVVWLPDRTIRNAMIGGQYEATALSPEFVGPMGMGMEDWAVVARYE
ncbi:hypothetical protein [Pontibacter sp. G13]|uniref:hypothetical protein n=1 Tax=Pontibacter sp. G13 TaxID=3074898 RepID=UPI00288AD44C|nr:hypothetical protein [Pontibacter sp. G13]WNJ21625.1 hypothetical protein RJD25_28915 [Pontibacter sp. G13]